MSGIRSRLHLNGVELQENEYLTKQMHRAARKGDSERVRCPFSKTLLGQLVKRLDFVTKSDYEAALFKAIFLMAYHGMFRVGELVESEHKLHVKNVMEDEAEQIVCIQHLSKTSKPGDLLVRVVLTPEDTDLCPCRAVKWYC